MSEARELLEKVRRRLMSRMPDLRAKGLSIHSSICGVVAEEIGKALATQPEPGAVPELPEFVTRIPDGASHRIKLKGPVSALWLDDAIADPDDLDRIAEACHILAARERARRAVS